MISNPGSKIKKKIYLKKETNNKYRSSIGKNKREREENTRLRLALKKGQQTNRISKQKNRISKHFFQTIAKNIKVTFKMLLSSHFYISLSKKKKKIRETPKIKFKLLLNFALKVVEKSNGKSDF